MGGAHPQSAQPPGQTGREARDQGAFDRPARRGFPAGVKERGAINVRSKPDLAFLAIRTKEELIELAYIGDEAVWVVYPKGLKTITQNDVIKAGRAAGLVDTKVCSFSATHTALRFKRRKA